MDAFGDDEPDWAFGDILDEGDGEYKSGNGDSEGGGYWTLYGAEHVVFLFDCDGSMFERYVPCLVEDSDDGDGQDFVSPIDVAVEAAHRFLRMKIRDVAETKSGRRDSVGVLLYGCDPCRAMRWKEEDSPNSDGRSGGDSDGIEEREGLPTTHELIELSPPGIEQVLRLQEYRVANNQNSSSEQRNMRKEFSCKWVGEDGEGKNGDSCGQQLHQGLTAAMKIFANTKYVKTPSVSSKQLPDSKSVWIFTSQDNPCHGDAHEMSRMNTLKRDYQEAGIVVHVVPLPKNVHVGDETSEFDRDIFYNNLTAPVKHVEHASAFVDSGGAVDVEAILSNFEMGMKKRRRYGTVPLFLPGWKERKDNPGMMLDLYGAVQVRNKPVKVSVHQEKNKVTIKRTKRINLDTNELVGKEDLHEFVDFCGRVPIQPANLEMMKKASNSLDRAGLLLHGFRSMKSLPTANLLSRNILAYPNDFRVQGSGKALYNLKQSMKNKNVFAVGELLARVSATSSMVALVPLKDESTGFLIFHLPYKEDMREVIQSDIGYADQNSVDAAKDLITSCTLRFEDFSTCLPENPWLKHFFGYLESVSLGQPLVELEDDAKMDVKRMLETAREEIDYFSLTLPEDIQIAASEKRKRKVPSYSKPEFAKEGISEEWIGRYKNDEMADCTANELKTFLKSQGERLTGKKADLVHRVRRCIEKDVFKE